MSADDRDLTEAELAGVAKAIAAGHMVFDFDAPEPELPPVPEAEPMVSRSVRLPINVEQKIKVLAEVRGVKASDLIRGWIDQGLADAANDQPISRADVLRLVAGLPPLPRAA